jgi:NAD(P)-dependent dehydrogenase (short-subunit alcohol dehydrogenase family)
MDIDGKVCIVTGASSGKVKRLLAQAIEAYGGVDVLVNNAGHGTSSSDTQPSISLLGTKPHRWCGLARILVGGTRGTLLASHWRSARSPT